MCGLRMLALRPCSGEPSTAFAVASAPVPAVVGTATYGTDGRSIGSPRPTTSRWSIGSVPLPSSTATALARSRTLPPPMATTTSAPAARACASTARASSTSGSRVTRATATGSTSPSRCRCRAGSLPVHSSTRDPRVGSSPASSAARPGPNSTFRGSARSNAAHQPSSAGNTAVNRVDARGCAIIPATASRQRA